jgi:hypothetical protein
MLIKGLKQTSSNSEFLVRMAKQAQVKGNGIDL